MFGATNTVKSSDKEKYAYSGYGTAFDGKGSWSFNDDFAGNIIIFGVDNSSSSHTFNLSINISIKNHAQYFFNGIIDIKNFDPNDIKIDEKSYRNILIYYIGYVTIKASKYVKTDSVNP